MKPILKASRNRPSDDSRLEHPTSKPWISLLLRRGEGNPAAKAAVKLVAGLLMLPTILIVFATQASAIGDYWMPLLGIIFTCVLATLYATRFTVEGLAGLRKATRLRRVEQLSPPGHSTAEREEKFQEQQILEILERYGQVTSARAALETTLTVAQAERKLGELAEGGHVDVGVSSGSLIYTLPPAANIIP